MLPLKDVTEAILALRRNGYSSYLLTHRTGSSSPPIHTRLDSPTHQLVAGALQRWTIGSNLEPDRSRPLELRRLRSAPEILEMELFGSDRLLETLRWSFGSDQLRLYWSCSIFYNILYPLESSLSSLRAEYDSKNIFGLFEIYI